MRIYIIYYFFHSALEDFEKFIIILGIDYFYNILKI